MLRYLLSVSLNVLLCVFIGVHMYMWNAQGSALVYVCVYVNSLYRYSQNELKLTECYFLYVYVCMYVINWNA